MNLTVEVLFDLYLRYHSIGKIFNEYTWSWVIKTNKPFAEEILDWFIHHRLIHKNLKEFYLTDIDSMLYKVGIDMNTFDFITLYYIILTNNKKLIKFIKSKEVEQYKNQLEANEIYVDFLGDCFVDSIQIFENIIKTETSINII